MSDIAVKVEGLGKRYRIGRKEEVHDTLFGALASWVRTPFSNFKELSKLSIFDEAEGEDDVIWALRDVSFEVKQGEVVGIIGPNGAGKSTLLKILSQITEPTSGRAIINGRVASLLEVGTGFHPELSGRENVYLNGTVLGMSKREVDHKFDEIVAFAGVETFIDTPIKRYSSGMQVRLAFAVAAHLEPEILLIDEVLAVGDAAFQKKCLGKMEDVAQGGRTILFVSHDMGAITQLCPQTLLIDHGRVAMMGPSETVIKGYLQKSLADDASPRGRLPQPRPGSKLWLTDVVMRNDAGNRIQMCMSGQYVVFSIQYESSFEEELSDLIIKLTFFDGGGKSVFTTSTLMTAPERFVTIPCSGWLHCTIPKLPLIPGAYTVGFFCKKSREAVLARYDRIMQVDVVEGKFFDIGRNLIMADVDARNGSVLIDHRWHAEDMKEHIDSAVRDEAYAPGQKGSLL